MNTLNFHNEYLHCITNWTGYEVGLTEDFDIICPSDVDFIEILLMGEKEFGINLLENTKGRQDFATVKDFFDWALTSPVLQIA